MAPPSASIFMTSKMWLNSTRQLRWLVSVESHRNPMEMPVYGILETWLWVIRVPSQKASKMPTNP